MARIYIARTTGIGSFERHVVLKLITPERANDQIAVHMFLDEARLAASLNHQNVAQVFEVGEDGGIHYLAMEYVHGQDLRALLAKAGSHGTRLPLELALTIVTGAAAGLHHAHERRGADGLSLGIVHRDVSPSNIMIGYDGSVKLVDFGIAKARQRSIETQSGIIKGKFAYMAPEQCRGRAVDRRTDVFSLGIILYEVTTQHRAFRAESDFDTMHRIVTGDIVRPTRLVRGYPPALEAIVMKALSVDAAQRYQSAGALLDAIESFASAARMSLSTMSLGRFVRELFGDLTEPWKTATGRASHPLRPLESTISTTNSTADPGGARDVRPEAPATLEEDEAEEDAELPAGGTLVDLPPCELEGPAAGRGPEWSSTTEPDLPPAVVTAAASTSEPVAASAAPEVAPQVVLDLGAQAPPSDRALPVHASQPVFRAPHAPGAPELAVPGWPLQGAPLTGSTRPGHASASTRGERAQALSQPLLPLGPPMSGLEPELRIRPNRRPLLIGASLVAAGVAAMLAMTGGGGEDVAEAKEPSGLMERGANGAGADRAPTMSASASSDREELGARAPATLAAATPPVPDGAVRTAADPTSIAIAVTSTPPGADVLLAGKVIGTTPLDTRRERSTGRAVLVVHKHGFVDHAQEIDLDADVTTAPTLVPQPARPTVSTPTPTPASKSKSAGRGKSTGRPARPSRTVAGGVKAGGGGSSAARKPACQPPETYNPLDPRPLCKARAGARR